MIEDQSDWIDKYLLVRQHFTTNFKRLDLKIAREVTKHVHQNNKNSFKFFVMDSISFLIDQLPSDMRPEVLENFEKTEIEQFHEESNKGLYDPQDALYFEAFFDDCYAMS